MMSSQPAVRALTPATPPSADVLADAMASEMRLVEELITIMKRQRRAVAVDDLKQVDDTVFATHRVLVTLSEARRRRHALNRMLGERGDMSIDALDEILGDRMTPQLAGLRDGLREAARTLSTEVAINRSVLREALAGGDAMVRTLAGGSTAPTYGGPSPVQERSNEGFLLNRRI